MATPINSVIKTKPKVPDSDKIPTVLCSLNDIAQLHFKLHKSQHVSPILGFVLHILLAMFYSLIIKTCKKPLAINNCG